MLSRETASKLDEFRAFRHVFRNAYGFNLSSDRLAELLNKFPHAAGCLQKEAHSFIETMLEIMPGGRPGRIRG